MWLPSLNRSYHFLSKILCGIKSKCQAVACASCTWPWYLRNTKSLWFVNNFELPNFELKSFFFKYLNYKILSAGGSHPTATSSRELTAHGVTALPSSVALSVLAFFFVLGFGFKLVSKAFAEACKGRGAKLGEPRLWNKTWTTSFAFY